MFKKEDYRIYMIPNDQEIYATRVMSPKTVEGFFEGAVDIGCLVGCSDDTWEMFEMLHPWMDRDRLMIQLRSWVEYNRELTDGAYWIDMHGSVR